jgi:flavin reductase (DIM6/NTAB) family NADH-FMN oxidoreductase RutF/uncharacterized protein YbbK (DUF523 family)
MAKSEIPPSESLYPVPVVLVSCLDRENNKANIITIAWCGIVASNPPQISVSIRPSRYSHKLLSKEHQFVVNVPSTDILKMTDLCGILSGKDIDKFAACSFTSVSSSKISAPMILECPVNIECSLRQIVQLGSHDMFIGEVVAVHVDEALLDTKGRVDYRKARPFVFNGGSTGVLIKRSASMDTRKSRRRASPRYKFLVSACLAGVNCAYNAESRIDRYIRRLVEKGDALPACPEVLGGAPVPRQRCEICGGDGGDVLDGIARALTPSGMDVSRLLIKGARETLELAKKHRIKQAILKSNSPSCGYGLIYDGTFGSILIPGNGVTAELLRRNKIKISTKRS